VEGIKTMNRELYVGSLPYETTEEDLVRLFSVSGVVQSVHIITDKISGKSKGCGYVKMTTVEEAKDAIDSLDGALVDNRKITVSEAREQKPVKSAVTRRPPTRIKPEGQKDFRK
jgi:RNA recognition motif-containing protein